MSNQQAQRAQVGAGPGPEQPLTRRSHPLNPPLRGRQKPLESGSFSVEPRTRRTRPGVPDAATWENPLEHLASLESFPRPATPGERP
jgi:hypothetical protein